MKTSAQADLSSVRIALCQPPIVQGNREQQRAEVDKLLQEASEAGAHFAIVPDMLGMKGHAFVVPFGETSLEGESDDSVLARGAFGELVLGFHAGVSGCDLLVLDQTRPFVLSGYKSVSYGVPAAVVSAAGVSNVGKVVTVYQGASRLLDADGRVRACLRDDFLPDVKVVSFADASLELRRPDECLFDALTHAIAGFDESVLAWKPRWVIGLSGGLDSSVVAALLVQALGSERVIGYNLATRFNSQATKGNAGKLAEALGIEVRSGSIEALVRATDEVLEGCGYDPAAQPSLVHENVQARLRGHMLSTFAAVEGGVVANNGNRVECALGYATLYGDAIGALAPIADLTKVQLFDVSRDVNRRCGREVVPENLLPTETAEGYVWQTRPSAELADGQYDPMKWFYHDWLISRLDRRGEAGVLDVMEDYARDKLASSDVAKWVRYYGLDDPKAFVDDLEWVVRSMRNAAFKRIQACPAIRLASPLTVVDEPEVQAPFAPSSAYRSLRERILAE